MAAMKETNFFSGPPGKFPYTPGAKRIKYLSEYENLFDSAFTVRGEASPNYTAYPRRRGTPERITQLIPDVKLIYLVRDPVARTVSHFHHRVSTEGEHRSLSGALSDLSDPYSPYLCPSFYALQLDQYLQHFAREQILVIDQAELLSNREATLREVFRFLSVNDSLIAKQFQEEINTAKDRRTYSKLIFLVRWARASPLQRIPRGVRVTLRDSFEKVVSQPLEPPRLSDELRARLQDLYARDVACLREMTGETFPTWSI
jgi:hypothetical protein